jgi:hypothetical protein
MTRTELADAMLRGLHTPGVEESRTSYISRGWGDNTCWACALGGAAIGYYDGDYRQAEHALIEVSRNQGEYDAFAELLDISPALAVEIEHKHLNGMSVEQIAAWLKTSESEADHV